MTNIHKEVDINWQHWRKAIKDHADKLQILDNPEIAERVKEWQDSKMVRDGIQMGDGARIKDPIGPIKYDLPDEILRGYVRATALEKRLSEVESHLENPDGKAFVRSESRPEVGADIFSSLLDEVKLLRDKVDALAGVHEG